MEVVNIVCPVCTLYLRPGITLKQHLTSHPKQKVIEALVKLSTSEESQKVPPPPQAGVSVSTTASNPPVVNQPWGPIPIGPPGAMHPQNIAHMQGNHVFIYQQSMSTTSPPQPSVVNPMNQQYVIPAVFNPQMMPYVYQQQQVIMSSNTGIPPHLRALPFEAPSSSAQLSEVRGITEMEKVDIVENEVAKETGREEEESSEVENNVAETPETNLDPLSPETASSPIKKQDPDDEPEPERHFDGGDQTNMSEAMDNEFCPPEEYEVDCEPDHDNDNHIDQDIDHEECVGTPLSSQHSSDWGFHSELNKACQTQGNNTGEVLETIPEAEVEEEAIEDKEETCRNNQQDYYYFDQPFEAVYTTNIENSYEQSDPIYTSANILHANDPMDFVGMDDIDNMQVIINDFPGAPVVSQVENFENTRPERPGVLMMIGEMNANKSDDFEEQRDESVSRESSNVNIRADERMPARGELSGQESMGGASDITWNKINSQDPGGSGTSNGYDLLESWDDSDGGAAAADGPLIVGYSGPPLNFKCSSCSESFASVKERKEHELVDHERKHMNVIGLDIKSERKPKKLVIRPKRKPTATTVDDKFGNTFKNRLKKEEGGPTASSEELKENILEAIKTDETVQIKSVCYVCNTIFDSKKDLRLHVVERHKSNVSLRNTCLTCDETFANEYKYTDHLRVHPLECKLCGKLFYRKQNIQLHIKRHLGLKPFKCEMCTKAFITKQKLEEHRNSHTGNAPVRCTLCPETFRRHSNMVQHRNRKHNQLFKKKVKDYICACGEVFHSRKKLAWHKEIHDAKPKACTQCSEKFIHAASLTRHMRRAHNAEFLPEGRQHLNINAECPVCKGTFLRSSLDAHLRVHNGQRPFACLICNKDFTTKWNLKLHKWTHASRTQKPFKCDQCKGAFIRESDYVAHMNSHKSVRPYTCNYCGAQFIRKYNCQRHVKEHENTKRYSCNVCGKSFHRSYYLKDHMRVHSGVRPYSCHICGKTSTTKSNHNKHVQIHHAREPVSTEN